MAEIKCGVFPMTRHFLYQLISPTGSIYIGQTKNLKNRYSTYKSLNCKDQPKLYNALLKYGWDSFTKNILLITDIEHIDYYEILFIEKLGCVENGLNCSSGGAARKVHSEETKEKIRKANTGRKQTDLTKEKKRRAWLNMDPQIKDKMKKIFQETIKGNQWNVGKHLPDETKLKLSLKLKDRLGPNKGRKFSNETRQKMSESHRGLNHSEITKNKIRATRTGQKRIKKEAA